jgi:hypothetical protein
MFKIHSKISIRYLLFFLIIISFSRFSIAQQGNITENYYIHYYQMEELVRLIHSNFPEVTVEVGTADAKKRSLILTASPEPLERVKVFLSRIDVPTTSIICKVKIVMMDTNDIKDLQIQWDNQLSNPLLTSTTSIIGKCSSGLDNTLLNLTEAGKAVVVNTKLEALNGYTSTCFFGNQFRYLINSQDYETKNSDDITIKLKSQIDSDNKIKMVISTNHREINTQLTGSETIAITGSLTEQDFENIKRILNIKVADFHAISQAQQRKNVQVMLFITASVKN